MAPDLCFISWLLCRYAGTVTLAHVEKSISQELVHRGLAALGRMSDPQQRPPHEFWLLATLAVFVATCVFGLFRVEITIPLSLP